MSGIDAGQNYTNIIVNGNVVGRFNQPTTASPTLLLYNGNPVGQLGDGATAALGLIVAGVNADSETANQRFSNDWHPPRLVLIKSRGGQVGAHGAVQVGDQLVEIDFRGDTGTNYSGIAGYIRVEAAGTFSGTSSPGDMVFATTPTGATSSTEALRIKSDKSTNFAGNLYVPSNITFNDTTTNQAFNFFTGAGHVSEFIQYINAASTAKIRFGVLSDTSGSERGYINFYATNSSGADRVYYSLNPSLDQHVWYTGNQVAKMRLTSAGRLLVGTSPVDDGVTLGQFNGTIKTAGYTVATLPAAGTVGRRAYVTDATSPTFLGTLTGGGSVVCPVFDDGTNWVAG